MTAHILFVDDNTSVLSAYRRNLGKIYKVTIVDCPNKALDMIKNDPIYDIVVSDIKMPGMDGITFLSAIKDFLPSSSRIVLSGYATSELALRVVNECMAFKYLTKPVNMDQLISTIEEALQAQEDKRSPSSDLNLDPKDRILLTDFDQALCDGGLMLHYQPKVDVRTGLVSSAEALLRWEHPKLGNISPARIIPLVEQSGRSDQLAHWVVKEACRQAAEWHFEQGVSIKVAINLSPANFQWRGMEEYIRTVLTETGCPPELLELEVTESLKLPTENWIWKDLNALKEMGVTLSVDDFGAGYSSFDHLNKLPIAQLKLDASLMDEVPHERKSVEVINLLIGLSHSLGLTVVAEGIETEDQLEFLREAGCDYIQGYYYSPALNSDDFLEWSINNNMASRVIEFRKIS